MSQLDNTLYIDLIIMFLMWSYFIGSFFLLWKDFLPNWSILIKFFWLNYICDLKGFISAYLMTQGLFGNKALKLSIIGKYFNIKTII